MKEFSVLLYTECVTFLMLSNCQYRTSTTLYITCIAGCQYNFIHITRILFKILQMTLQGASIILFISLEFCLILLMTSQGSSIIIFISLEFCLILLMTSQGASIISFISLEFCLILLMTLGSQIGVPNWGPKLGSQIGVPNRGPKWGCPKSGSKIRVPNGGVPN
jgi:hypothetical protein